ncbi:MAG: hypothetical protein VB070_10105 [Clostridiaceae bacterium]|nr:hypothetical protein [Clostridiaceae bacterium]
MLTQSNPTAQADQAAATAGGALRWYRLDNAAKIYPVIMRSRHISVFRLAALMRDPVDPRQLQTALEQTLLRFPYFAVRLKRGAFWYYLESCANPPAVEEDVQNPLRPWSIRDEQGYLFRVRYDGRRISAEFFHALTDGYGGLVFLKTLIAAYLAQQGVQCPPGGGILDLHGEPEASEMEDAYKRFSNFRVTRRPRETRAFHLQGTIMPGHNLHIICGILPIDRVAAVAGLYHVSVTEFLVGVYLYQLYQIQQQGGYRITAPVRVSVPINIRRFYPTGTLRNFALYANPGIEPAYGVYDFEEILQLVHHFMRYTVNEKYLNALMCANVAPEKSMLLRLSPLPLKNLVMRLGYGLTGESRFTSTLSNLGIVKMPEAMSGQVERLEFLLGPSRYNPVNCSVISTGNNLVIQFSATMTETDPQRAFFKHLIRLGLPVKIESNQICQTNE